MTRRGTALIAATIVGGAHSPAQEIGPDDFRITEIGAPGAFAPFPLEARVACSATDNEYLVVWGIIDNAAAVTDIAGQRVAADGTLQGGAFGISDFTPLQDGFIVARDPAVAWNATDNEFLVVWSDNDGDADGESGETEIFGQILGSGGSVVRNDFQISAFGPAGNRQFRPGTPAISWDSTNNRYLVVWSGLTPPDSLAVYGQVLDANGDSIGGNFLVSDQGWEQEFDNDFIYPRAVWNATAGEHLVVWEGDLDNDASNGNELEIFGLRLLADGSPVLGTGVFRISQAGTDGDAETDATMPAVTWSATSNRYLVTWMMLTEFSRVGESVRGQLLDAAGSEIGPDDFLIGDLILGSGGDVGPHVTWNPTADEFLVSWNGDPPRIQRLDPDGGRVGLDGYRLTCQLIANDADVVYNAAADEFFAVWESIVDFGSGFETELFGQRILPRVPSETETADGLLLRNTIRVDANDDCLFDAADVVTIVNRE